MLSRLANVHSRRTLNANHLFCLIRAASNRPVGFRGDSSTSTKRPLNDLHYHLMKAPPDLQHWTESVFAVSFLPEPPPTVEGSKTILGVVPALENEEPGLNDFKENSRFIELMHDAIRAALADGADESVLAEAIQRGSGWLHIQDRRNIPALGRIGDPDDILGSVMVEGGKILPETYQKMPSYRLFTADGPPQLPTGLAKKLEEILVIQQKAEKAT